MKMDLFLFIFALIIAFISGNITYSIKSDDKANFKDLKEIQKLHIELQEEITPSKRLDLNHDYPNKEFLKLLERKTQIAANQRQIILNSSECLKSKISQLSSSFINKKTLWMAFLCNQVDSLPINFYNTPPFIHTNGLSYSYMKYKSYNTKMQKINWLENYAKYMHISELKKLQWFTTRNQRFLVNLSTETINRILGGEEAFLSSQYYFIKNGHLKYYIINKNIAARFFKRARYSFSKDGKSCLFKFSNTCWSKRPHNLQSLFSQSTIVVFIGTLIILFLTAHGLYTRLRRKKLEEERKKHALRILTHELRTPIASLLLQVNQINQSPDDLPAELQEQLLKIEGQVYRLKHLAQKSQSYLQTDNTDFISLSPQVLPSLKEFFQELLVEYEGEDIKLLGKVDFELQVDPYWLKMCVMNLIDNALRYGKPPIEIELAQDEHCYKITIRDHGSIPYMNIKELLKARHDNSKGLGLGIIIVNKTLKEMGAKLTLNSSPTEFEIKITKTPNLPARIT